MHDLVVRSCGCCGPADPARPGPEGSRLIFLKIDVSSDLAASTG
jgi:hypothetical protein